MSHYNVNASVPRPDPAPESVFPQASWMEYGGDPPTPSSITVIGAELVPEVGAKPSISEQIVGPDALQGLHPYFTGLRYGQAFQNRFSCASRLGMSSPHLAG